MSNWNTRNLVPTHTESGVNFITIYFKSLNECNLYAKRLYNKLSKAKWPYIELQREEFRHLPGDPEHFHSDGPAAKYWENYRHFHIIYPRIPNKDDWEYLYKVCNDRNLRLYLHRDIPTREVKTNAQSSTTMQLSPK